MSKKDSNFFESWDRIIKSQDLGLVQVGSEPPTENSLPTPDVVSDFNSGPSPRGADGSSGEALVESPNWEAFIDSTEVSPHYRPRIAYQGFVEQYPDAKDPRFIFECGWLHGSHTGQMDMVREPERYAALVRSQERIDALLKAKSLDTAARNESASALDLANSGSAKGDQEPVDSASLPPEKETKQRGTPNLTVFLPPRRM